LPRTPLKEEEEEEEEEGEEEEVTCSVTLLKICNNFGS
jgi:hypothetical protein